MANISSALAPIIVVGVGVTTAVLMAMASPAAVRNPVRVYTPALQSAPPAAVMAAPTAAPKNVLHNKVVTASVNASLVADNTSAAILRSLDAELRALKTQPKPLTAKPLTPVNYTPPTFSTPAAPVVLNATQLLQRLSNSGDIMQQNTKGRGVQLQLRRGAKILAPANGLVVYAGEFRSYGRVIILKLDIASDKKYLVLSGRHTLRVTQGKQVLSGQTIAAFDPTIAADLYAEWRTGT